MKWMRKAALLTALAACLLSACAPAGAATKSGRTFVRLEMLTSWNGSCAGTSSEEGYYWLDSRPDGSIHLLYYDYASGGQGVLCTDPGCSHSGEGCSGWIAKAPDGVVPLVCGRQLLLVFRGGAESPRVEVMDLSGGGRRELACLEEGEELMPPFVRTAGGILCVCKRVQGRQNERDIVCLDTRTGELTRLFSVSHQEMKLVGAAGTFLLVQRNDPGREADLYAFEPQTGTMRLLETDCNAGGIFFFTDQGYGSVDEQGAVSFCAAPDFQRQVLEDCRIPPDSVYFEDSMDDKALFRVHSGGTVRLGLDTGAGTLRKLDGKMEYNGVREPAEIAAKLRRRLLVVTRASLTTDETGAVHRENQYALVSKEDFWNGRMP